MQAKYTQIILEEIALKTDITQQTNLTTTKAKNSESNLKQSKQQNHWYVLSASTWNLVLNRD